MENYEKIKKGINEHENDIIIFQQKINDLQLNIMNKNFDLEDILGKINKTQEVRIKFLPKFFFFLFEKVQDNLDLLNQKAFFILFVYF